MYPVAVDYHEFIGYARSLEMQSYSFASPSMDRLSAPKRTLTRILFSSLFENNLSQILISVYGLPIVTELPHRRARVQGTDGAW